MLVVFICLILINMHISHMVDAYVTADKSHKDFPGTMLLTIFIMRLKKWDTGSAIIVIGCIIALTLIRCFG